MKKINELNVNDNGVVFSGLINHVNMGKNAKSTYLSITIQDSTGEVECKLWSASNEQIETLVPGVFVDLVGDVIKYNDGIQVKLSRIAIKDVPKEELDAYIRSSTIKLEEMQKLFEDSMKQIESLEVYEVVNALYDRYMGDFLKYPAASKNHHNYLSGLAEHTYRMLKMALELCDLYPLLDKDLMIGGVLLHDMGKIVELSGPIIPSYTFEGKLLGHITIGENMIDEMIKELNLESEKLVLLKHIVLSHHGKLEFGSPVLPAIPEAEMIYLIDNIDAKMNMLIKAFDEIEPGEFTKRIFPLDNRSFYKAKK